jgi:transposase-like protein
MSTVRLTGDRPVGQIIDVLVSERRDAAAARLFFKKAIGSTKATPVEVVTDQAAVYPKVLDELAPAAWHRTEQYANNRMEADHGQLKRRLRPMRGLKLTSAPESSSPDTPSSRTFAAATTSSQSTSPPRCDLRSPSTNSSWRCDTDEPTETGPACLPI